MVLEAVTYYLHSLLKLTEASINDLLLEVPYHPPKSDIKYLDLFINHEEMCHVQQNVRSLAKDTKTFTLTDS